MNLSICKSLSGILILSTMCLALPACKGQSRLSAACAQSQETLSTQRYAHDSVVLRDSIFVREYSRDDTVWRDRWHDRWHERVVVRTDTVWCDREVVRQLPPERYVPPVYRRCTYILLIVCLLAVLRVAYALWRGKWKGLLHK